MTTSETAKVVRERFPALPHVKTYVGFSIFPVEAEFVESVTGAAPHCVNDDQFLLLTEEFRDWLRKLSHIGKLAYIETEYHGGVGGQGAAVYCEGNEILAPVWSGSDSINEALAALGVPIPLQGDRFSTIGLGACTTNEDLLNAAGVPRRHDAPGAPTTPSALREGVRRLGNWDVADFIGRNTAISAGVAGVLGFLTGLAIWEAGYGAAILTFMSFLMVPIVFQFFIAKRATTAFALSNSFGTGEVLGVFVRSRLFHSAIGSDALWEEVWFFVRVFGVMLLLVNGTLIVTGWLVLRRW